jgi:hypothetical protein
LGYNQQNWLYPKILLYCYVIGTSKLVIPKNITLLLPYWCIKTTYAQTKILYCYVIDWHIKTAYTQKILLYCYVIDTSKLVIPKKCYFIVTWLTHQNCVYPKILLGCYLIDTSKLVIPKNITLLLPDWCIKTAYAQKILLYCYVIDWHIKTAYIYWPKIVWSG